MATPRGAPPPWTAVTTGLRMSAMTAAVRNSSSTGPAARAIA
jgi:hypothetical protein